MTGPLPQRSPDPVLRQTMPVKRRCIEKRLAYIERCKHGADRLRFRNTRVKITQGCAAKTKSGDGEPALTESAAQQGRAVLLKHHAGIMAESSAHPQWELHRSRCFVTLCPQDSQNR
jgi:hypothetical protein